MNIKDIINAWASKINPSEDEINLAQERSNICSGCVFKKSFFSKKEWSSICGQCGCPITSKIFSKEFNSCPEKKWEGVDSKYIKIFNHKKNKTII